MRVGTALFSDPGLQSGAGLFLMYNRLGLDNAVMWIVTVFLTLESFESQLSRVTALMRMPRMVAWACHVWRLIFNLYTTGNTALHANPAGDDCYLL